jgi:hypothetical protein
LSVALQFQCRKVFDGDSLNARLYSPENLPK